MDATAFLQGSTRLSLCLLFGLTLVLALPGWKPQREYLYQINGRTVAGIASDQNQHVGIHYRGMLKLQTHSPSILVTKLISVTYWQIHEELPEGWWAESSSSSQEKFSELPLTNSSFIVKLAKQGEVEIIYLNSETPDWEKNFIKGIVSQLEFKIKAALKGQPNAIHGSEFSESSSWERIMENTAFGRCETLYQVLPVPHIIAASFPKSYPPFDVCTSKNYYEIYKTTNFSNCEGQAETHFGLPETTKCDPAGNFCGEFWNRVSGSRITGCIDKKEFIVLHTETNSREIANLKLHNASMASISSYIAMNLTSIKRLEQRLSLPSPRIALSPLGYQYTTYDFTSINDFLDMKSEEEAEAPDASNVIECVDENGDVSAANNGKQAIKCNKVRKRIYNVTKPQATSTSFWDLPPFDFEYPPQQPLSSIFLHEKECPTVNNQIQKLKEIITDVASDLEDAQNTPNTLPLEKLTFAVQLCRAMSLTSLKKAIGKIMDRTIKNNKLLLTERRLYRDVVMMCGTGPSVKIIAEWIEQYKITGEDAANIIASIPAHLRDPRPEVVQWLYNLTQMEAIRNDRTLSITANLALSNFVRIACVNKKAREVRFPRTVLSSTCTLKHIEPYLRWFSSQLKSDPSLRRVYILALGNTGTYFGLEELKSVATNSNYSVYLRATAVVALKYQAFLYSEDTSKALFSLFQDYTQPIPVRISAVSSIFFSRPRYDIWQRIALSTWYEPSTSVAGFVRSSLVSLSKFKDPGYESMSRNARRVVLYSKPISSTLSLSYNWLWATIFEELEEVWAYQHIVTNEIDAGSIYFRATKRIAQLTRLPFDGEIWLSNKDEFLNIIKDWIYPRGNTSEVRPPIDNLERTTRKVREMLNIKQRTMPDMEGELHGTVDKLSERLFIFDKKYIKQWLNGLEIPTNQMQFNYHYQNMNLRELEFCTVTELGFPLCFVHYEPWYIRFTAKIKASQTTSTVEPTVSLMFMEQQIGKLSFYTPWDQTTYAVESHGLTMAHIPEINLKAQFGPKTQRLEFEIQTKVPENGHLLLQRLSQTFTSHRNVGDSASRIMTRTWKPISFKPSSQVYKSLKLGKHFEAHFNYSTLLPYSSPLDCLQNPGSLSGFWRMWQSLKTGNLQIKIFNVPNMNINIGTESAKAQNGKVIVADDTDKDENEAKSMSAREEDLLSQIEIGLNVSRKTRTIPSGSARPAADKPTVTHTTVSPNPSTTVSPAKELLSNIISQAARDVVEEVMHAVKGNQNTETSPSQQVSEVFDASSINLTQEHDYSTYLLRESLKGISNGNSKLIYMNITLSDAHKSEKHESKYSVHITYAENDDKRHQNLGMFLKKESERNEWEIGWTSTLLSPEVSYLNLKDIHQTSFEGSLFSSLQYRLQDNYHNAALQVNMHRSDKKMEVLSKRLIQRQCLDMINPECRTLAYEAMLSDSYNVTLLYSNEEQYVAPWIEKSLDLSSFYLLPYSSTAQFKNSSRSTSYNVMKVALNVAEDLRSCNLQADTKSKLVVFQDIPVRPELMKMLLYNPRRSVSRLFSSRSVCGMSLRRISTFDEAGYNYNMTKTWHVLTKDATGKTRFMILARASENATIELEINMDNHVVVSVNSSNIAVQQGKANIEFDTVLEYRDLNNTLLLRLNHTSVPESTVTIECPEHGMDIIYNKSTVLIKAHEMTRGRLVGLCGDNNGEKIAEFQTPSKTIVRSPQEFAASYALLEHQPLTTSETPPSSTTTAAETTTATTTTTSD